MSVNARKRGSTPRQREPFNIWIPFSTGTSVVFPNRLPPTWYLTSFHHPLCVLLSLYVCWACSLVDTSRPARVLALLSSCSHLSSRSFDRFSVDKSLEREDSGVCITSHSLHGPFRHLLSRLSCCDPQICSHSSHSAHAGPGGRP